MIHNDKHPQAGETVEIKKGTYKGEKYRIEDWWDRVAGFSWMNVNRNPACLKYAIRAGAKDHLPIDNDVLYGHMDGLGELIHASEI